VFYLEDVEENNFVDVGINEIILKWIWKRDRCLLDSYGTVYEPAAGSC
jgi:hypothetical protein